MDYDAVLTQVVALLQQEQRVAYRVLKRRLQLDDETLEDLCGAPRDRHMTPAGRRKRFLGPPCPAVLELEAGQAGHQVQLGWPGIPELDEVEVYTLVREHYMLPHHSLLHGIVHGDFKVDEARLHLTSLHPLAPVKPGEIGDKGFEHKGTVVRQMLRDPTETAHLVVLGEHSKKGIEDHKDEREAALDRHIGKIPDGHGKVRPAGLGL